MEWKSASKQRRRHGREPRRSRPPPVAPNFDAYQLRDVQRARIDQFLLIAAEEWFGACLAHPVHVAKEQAQQDILQHWYMGLVNFRAQSGLNVDLHTSALMFRSYEYAVTAMHANPLLQFVAGLCDPALGPTGESAVEVPPFNDAVVSSIITAPAVQQLWAALAVTKAHHSARQEGESQAQGGESKTNPQEEESKASPAVVAPIPTKKLTLGDLLAEPAEGTWWMETDSGDEDEV